MLEGFLSTCEWSIYPFQLLTDEPEVQRQSLSKEVPHTSCEIRGGRRREVTAERGPAQQSAGEPQLPEAFQNILYTQ